MSAKPTTKASELKAFLFISIVLFPALSVGIVGGLGFIIWMSQLLSGPGSF